LEPSAAAFAGDRVGKAEGGTRGVGAMMNSAMERALQVAVVTGLRSALGPAFAARAGGRPERRNLALAALGEMVYDKLPYVPSRDALPSLIVRGAAGAWAAHQVMQAEGEPEDPWAAPLGAAVAMGVAVAAPKVRRAVGWSTGMPQFVLGLIEDYLALKLGARAVGMSMAELPDAALEAVDCAREHLGLDGPSWSGSDAAWSRQSAGAGSM
jgi:hypothetical protein